MMYIIVQQQNILPGKHFFGDTLEYVWRVGGSTPIRQRDVDRVIEVQADGDELQYILACFIGLPVPHHKLVARWFGDHAKFIAGNL